MGAAGKALSGNGKRHRSTSPPAQSKDGVGLPPHPLTLRSGQRYVARAAARRRLLQIGRIDRKAARATARRLDGKQERVPLSIARVLATRPDGQGQHYQFQGFDPRRYRTFAWLAGERADGQAELVLPEWHPARPVPHPARLLPDGASAGAWMSCTADLSQGRAAWLNVADFQLVDDPGPERCHRPAYQPPPPPPQLARPTEGRGCGDIVLELVHPVDEEFLVRSGLLDIYVIERPTATRSGDRVYLARDGEIDSYLTVRGHQLRPAGDFLRCEPTPVKLAVRIPVSGRVEQHHWRWRWWPRALEDGASPAELAAAGQAHDPLKHNEDYLWTFYSPPTRPDTEETSACAPPP